MSGSTPPDPERLAEGEARLEQGMEELDRRLEEYLSLWAARLEEELTAPLREAVSGARDAHARLMEAAGLNREGGAPEDDGTPVWCALRRYREGVLTDVVEPLEKALEEARPGSRVGDLWDDFLREVEAAAAPLPEVVERPEVPDLYASTPGQGFYHGMVKRAVRTGRAFTGVFTRDRIRAQRVPLRALAREHFTGEALPGVVDHAEALQQHHAHPVAVLETAVGRWVRDWFPLEEACHEAEAHLDRETAARLARLRERVAPVRMTLEGEEEGKTGETPDGGSPPAGADPSPPEHTPGPSPDHAPSDAGDQGEGGEGGDPETSREPEEPTSASVALALQAALESQASLPAPAEILERVRSDVEILRTRLMAAVRVADSPLARPRSESETKRLGRLAERLARRRRRWSGWHETARGRFHFSHQVLALRRDLDGSLDRLLDGVASESLLYLDHHLGGARDALLDLKARVRDPDSPLQAGTDPEAVAEAVAETMEEAMGILESRLLEPVKSRQPRDAIFRTAETATQTLSDRLRQLPAEAVVHPIRPVQELVDPTQATRTIPMRETAHQALDVLHLESLRTSPTPVLEFLEQAREECRGIPEVVTYNLTAAREELLQEEDAPAEDGEEEDARTLTVHGLERAARGIDAILARSLSPWERFTARAHEIFHGAVEQIHVRLVTEGAVQEQMRDVRSLLEGWLRVTRRAVIKTWTATERQLRRFVKKRYIQALRLIRRGRHALGEETAKEGEAERALEILRNISSLLAPLPLVYRRLFSFQPVSDPSLLVGRDDETAWVTRRYQNWKDGQFTPNVLTGPVTVGHTSFFNVLTVGAFQDARVVRLSLQERYRFEATLAERVARELRAVEEHIPEEGPWSFQRLAGIIRDTPTGEEKQPPLVVLVEHLAHTFLRRPGGTALAEAFLAFQSRTAHRIFWLSSVSAPAWKLLAKAEPRAASLVTTNSLSAPDRADLEEIIMARHRRSGVPVEFLPPADPNPLLKRRLQKARTEEDRQVVLRSEFFDRLHRASQGNVIMAILLWLRAADFNSREGWLRASPPRGVRFAFMEELDVGLDFALMAFLEHGSLTVEEYAAALAVSHEEASQALEALRGRMLLDLLETRGGLPAVLDRVEPGVRYRIPPILGQVVTGYLRNHNILH